MKQELVRTVSKWGNSAGVLLPREWLNEEVVIIRTPKRPVHEEILKTLEQYLNKIIAVWLYGSYARGEATKDSDIDVFVISSEKFKITKKGFDVIVITPDNIKKALDFNPILMYSIIQEAKPIINSALLDELKSQKIEPKKFKDFVESTKRIIKIDKGFLEMDKEEGASYVSESIVYSEILRLRGMFIIKCLTKGNRFSNALFKRWLKSNIKDLDFESAYKIYSAIRSDKKPEARMKLKDAFSLWGLLENEAKKLEESIK
jgi:predicted nucleotidyltransferase